MGKQKLSLQEQLLKSGLVSAAQAKTAKTEKRKHTQQQRKNNVVVVDEIKENAQKMQAERVERDRELNELRKRQEEQKALAAQVRQLVELNRMAQDDNGVAYHFSDGNRMKTVYVTEEMRQSLINGRLAVVKLEGLYEIVPAEVAGKIRERDPQAVLVLNEPAANPETCQDDPYGAYQIPDDLVW